MTRRLLAIALSASSLLGCSDDGATATVGTQEVGHTEVACTSHLAQPGAPMVFFAPFDPVEEQVLCLLDKAESEVVIAHYNIRRQSYLDKLVELHERGIDVRVAVDGKNAGAEHNLGDDFLEQSGIPLVRTSPSGRALMHLKTTVIDRTYAMTGSFNWNGTAALANDENMIVVREPEVVEAYRQEVLETLGEVPKTNQGGDLTDEISLHFVPEVPADTLIIDEIEAAEHSIDIAMFTLTMNPIRDALVEALQDPNRDVRVRLVIEGDRAWGDDVNIEQAGGLVVRQPNTIGTYSAMHQKYAIFDGNRVISGATNWTYNGTRRNAEDLLVLRDPAVVKRFEENFADLLSVYGNMEDDVAAPKAESHVLFNALADFTEWGEWIVVTGNDPALGNWDPWRGVVLDTSTSMFPSWTAAANLPAGKRVEYKFVHLRPDGTVHWEPGENRILDLRASGRAAVVSGPFGDTSDSWHPADP